MRDDVIKEREVSGIWSTHEGDEKCLQNFGRQTGGKEVSWKI
jgi:hypothetical protein